MSTNQNELNKQLLESIEQQNKEKVKTLLYEGADACCNDNKPLSSAIEQNHTKIIEILLTCENPADPNAMIRDRCYITGFPTQTSMLTKASMLAIERMKKFDDNSVEALKLLLNTPENSFDLELHAIETMRTLRQLALAGHLIAVTLLLKHGIKDNDGSAFWLATSNNHIPVMDVLLEASNNPAQVLTTKNHSALKDAVSLGLADPLTAHTLLDWHAEHNVKIPDDENINQIINKRIENNVKLVMLIAGYIRKTFDNKNNKTMPQDVINIIRQCTSESTLKDNIAMNKASSDILSKEKVRRKITTALNESLKKPKDKKVKANKDKPKSKKKSHK